MLHNMLGRPGDEDLLGIVGDFVTKLRKGKIKPLEAKRFLRRENPFMDGKSQKVRGVKNLAVRQSPDDRKTFNLWLSRLPEFWQKFWDIKIDLSIFEIPKKLPAGFAWPIYIPAGFSHNNAVTLCQQQFHVWKGVDIQNCGDAKGFDKPRLLLVRPTVEPDAEHLGKSIDDLVATGKLFTDFGVRSVLEAQYCFMTNGSHLDVKGWTYCPKSHFFDYRVARAVWNADRGEFELRWDYLYRVNPRAGGREAVLLPLKS